MAEMTAFDGDGDQRAFEVGYRSALADRPVESHDAIAELDRLRAERDTALVVVERLRGDITQLCGQRDQAQTELKRVRAELDRARPVVDAAIALVADWSAHRATHGGDLWAAVDIYTGVEASNDPE